MEKKTKVLLIQNTLQRYRAPIYKLIQDEVDLQLAYTEKNDIDDPNLKVMKLPSFKLGSIRIHTNLYKILNQYDVVISQPHLSCIRLLLLQWLPRKFKLINWGIGVHASYSSPFDLSKKPTLADRITERIQDASDACIFYMRETIDYWAKYRKLDYNKYFVAHNTVEVADFGEMPRFEQRDSFLFVGTLYAQKGLGELIEAYQKAKESTSNLPKLNIVGKGPEQDIIQEQIINAGLEKDIILCGPIYDENVLKDFFLRAILCISPKQAGLSVQKSFGYGTPFVTRPDAITGGERLDIKEGYNGFFYNNVAELAEILIDSCRNTVDLKNISKNARNYYLKYCQPKHMANGAIEAIRYVLR